MSYREQLKKRIKELQQELNNAIARFESAEVAYGDALQELRDLDDAQREDAHEGRKER